MVRIKDNEARTEVVGLRTERKRQGSKPFRKWALLGVVIDLICRLKGREDQQDSRALLP